MMSTRSAESEEAKLRQDIEALKADIASLTDTLKQLASDKKDQGMNRVRASAAKAEAQAQEALADVERRIGERPIASVLIALGFGIVLGKLLSR